MTFHCQQRIVGSHIVSWLKSADSYEDQAQIAKITDQNIHTIINTRPVTTNQRTTEERLANTVTNLLGAHVF
jgi:uncharacterized membrane protein